MSLVIASNQDSDKTATTNSQSIFKPYSFRNALSSTMTIPKNAQVGLQSAKINLDGSFSLAGNSYVFYQYYGQDLVNGSDTITNNSTAVPIRTQVIESVNDQVKELTARELAQLLQGQVEEYIYHPNLQYLVDVNASYNPSTNEFNGFDIEYDQFDTANNTIPSDSQAVDFGNPVIRVDELTPWTYSSGVFTTAEPDASYPTAPQVMISSGLPLSAYNGSFVVDFSDPNDNELEWGVGLSRFANDYNGFEEDGLWSPEFYSPERGNAGAETDQNFHNEFFFDYMVGRKGDSLVLYHTPTNQTDIEGNGQNQYIYQRAVDYTSSANSDFSSVYDLATNASAFESVRYTLTGQQVKIEMLDGGGNASTLYEYSSGDANTSMLKSICQSTWHLHPVLYIESSDTEFGNSMTITQYTACTNLTDKLPNWTAQDSTVSWWSNLEGVDEGVAWALEQRPWNNDAETTRTDYITYAGIRSGSHQTIDLENFLIFKPDDLFTPSTGANTSKLLGFTDTPTKNYTELTGAGNTLKRLFSSDTVPKLLSTKSIFVRLDNFGVSSVNARQGNKSSIISHMPRFGDGNDETGRIFYEPNNIIYLDLNNSEPIKVNSFDVSFVYSNEQYATALVGQSVVVLHFREKPK